MSYPHSYELEQGQQISQNSQSSQFIIPKHSARKQLCDVCQNSLFKYTCPRCQIKSCGINCLNKHKKANSCSGINAPFFDLQSKHMDERQVQKDYIFVKQMLSNADKVKRTLTGVDSLSQQPKRFKIMRVNAKKLYNITILNAPSIIERHRQNISFYFVKTKTFYWIVQILYWREQLDKDVCSRFITQPEPDSKQVLDILPTEFLCRELLQRGINTQKRQEFTVFIERKEKSEVKKQAIEIESKMPLRDALINQTIYEFPTLIAVHSSLVASYLKNRLTKQT